MITSGPVFYLPVLHSMNTHATAFVSRPQQSRPNARVIKGLIFDMDLTLYHSPGLSDATKDAARSFALSMGLEKQFLEKKEEKNSITGALKALGLKIDDYYDFLGKTVEPSDYLYPDEALRNYLLKLSRKYSLSVLTNNGDHITSKTLNALGIKDLFPVIITQQSAGVGKPKTEIFENALRILGLKSSECISIGDRKDIDLDPAGIIGIHGILVTGPDDIIADLDNRIAEIEEMIK